MSFSTFHPSWLKGYFCIANWNQVGKKVPSPLKQIGHIHRFLRSSFSSMDNTHFVKRRWLSLLGLPGIISVAVYDSGSALVKLSSLFLFRYLERLVRSLVYLPFSVAPPQYNTMVRLGRVETFQCENKGRGLRTTADVQPGEELLAEKPLVYTLTNKETRGTRCDFCFADAQTLLHCARCKSARYCNQQCQKSRFVLYTKI